MEWNIKNILIVLDNWMIKNVLLITYLTNNNNVNF